MDANVVETIERHGVAVARVAFSSDTVSAFSVHLTRRPLIVLGSDKSNYVRSRFDAAHELGHLVMHVGADPSDRAIESQAHAFAASLLLPNEVALDVLPRRIDGPGWATLAGLKRDFKISSAALLFRSRELELLSTDRYRSAMKQMSAKGWRKTEPGDRQMGPPEAPRLLEQALAVVTRELHISTEDFIDQARLPVDDVAQLISLSSDTRLRLSL